jgi:hypothetical protein
MPSLPPLALLLLLGAPLKSNPLAAEAYPGARLLVEKEIQGRTIRIQYRCYAVVDPVERVAAHYARDSRYARATFRLDAGELAFALKRDKEFHVAIFPMANAALHRQCEAKPEAGERTLMQISHGTAR